MASFRTLPGVQSNALENSSLLYVHCVSEVDMSIQIVNLACLELVCREIHVSFIDNLAERRVALLPQSNGHQSAEIQFRNADSPVLISVLSSCNTKFKDSQDSREEAMDGTLIWDLQIIPSPASYNVRPVPIREARTTDQQLPPLNLDMVTSCNCFGNFAGTKKCLVTFDTYREPDETVDPLAGLFDDLGLNSDEQRDEEELDEQESEDQESATATVTDNNDDDVYESDTNYVECFKIVGSHWEQRYQDSLQKCYDLCVSNQQVIVRAEPEPNNISDSNGIKFEIYNSEQWHIMGYCGVKKIPKLKRARHTQSIVSLQIYNLRRTWVPRIREFRYIGGVNIVKRGQWEKDDPQNMYNSFIPL